MTICSLPGSNSLAIVNVLMNLEDKFDIELPDDKLSRKTFSTVRHPQVGGGRSVPAGRTHMNMSGGLDAATMAAAAVAAEHAVQVDRESRIPEQAIGAMRNQGLMSLLVPQSDGGPGRSLSQVASVCHVLATILRFLGDDLRDAPDPGSVPGRARTHVVTGTWLCYAVCATSSFY